MRVMGEKVHLISAGSLASIAMMLASNSGLAIGAEKRANFSE